MTAAKHVLGLVALVLAAALLLAALATAFVDGLMILTGALSLQHVLGIDTQQSKNYDFVSGVGPLMVTALGFSSLGVAVWKHINCEYPGCPWPGHRHPGHGRPVCRRHYHHDVVPPKTG